MSDQTPNLSNLGMVDGRNLINIPGAGIFSINGDTSANQFLTVGAGLGLFDVPPFHNIFGIPFAPGVAGIVNDPGAAAPTDYLGADNTFHSITPGGVLSINADPAAAQTIVAGTGITIVDGGGGAHTISLSGSGVLVSINGDTTPAQTITAGTAVQITDNGIGDHTIDVPNIVHTIESDGSLPTSGAVIAHFSASIDGVILTPGFSVSNSAGPVSTIQHDIKKFAPGNAGLVSNPGAAAATDYLGADNTFRAIPVAAAITSINADTTAAQNILAGVGITVTNLGANHTIAGALFNNTTQGDVPGSGGGTTNFLRADGTWNAPPGTSVGREWILADPNFTVGSSFERISKPLSPYGNIALIHLKPNLNWPQVIANAVASPPGGWTITNSGNFDSADENTTTANALFFKHKTTGQTTNNTAPGYYKSYYLTPEGRSCFIARIASANITTDADRYAMFWVRRDGTPDTGPYWYMGLNRLSAGATGIEAGNGSTSATAGATVAEGTAGIWFRIEFASNRQVLYWYNKTNQATPPTTGWTLLKHDTDAAGNTLPDAETKVRVGFWLLRGTGTSLTDVNVLYYDDTPSQTSSSDYVLQNNLNGATGFDDQNPVLTVVAGYDLGSSSATVADADVQAALTEITNQRSIDTATITWSVSRGGSSPVACGGGAYAAPGSVSVGGTGRYISFCAKFASTNRNQPGSVQAANLRVPYTP